jgi:tetratricopeptide (TPR) repeat protein
VERIRQISPKTDNFEVIDFRLCVQYANGILTPEEYAEFMKIQPSLQKEAASLQDQRTSNSPGSTNIQVGGNIGNISITQTMDINEIVRALEEKNKEQTKRSQDRERQYQDREQNLTELLKDAVKALADKQRDSDASAIEVALAQLKDGKTELAKQIFRGVLDQKKLEGKKSTLEAASAARHLGALAFLTNNEEALEAYRQAVLLDPDNLEGQNQLAAVLVRSGELKEAEAVLIKVLHLAEKHGNAEMQAIAAHNLGNIFDQDSKPDQAEEMFRQGLALNESLGRKKGVAANYNSLAILYSKLGKLRQAEDMSCKSIAIYREIHNDLRDAYDVVAIANSITTLATIYLQQLNDLPAEQNFCVGLNLYREVNNKEGMGKSYNMLGLVYEMRGNSPMAWALYRKSLKLFDDVHLTSLHRKVEEAITRVSSSSGTGGKLEGMVCGAEIAQGIP